MADSKYANVPGIAHDQADTYETPDLPESDQYIDFNEEEPSQYIDRPNISVESAFERFRSQRVGGAGADFEFNRGYRTEGNLEVVAESTGEKLARLRLEITELGEALRAQPPADKSQMTDLQSLEQDLGKLVKREKSDSTVLQKKLLGFTENASTAGNGLQYELHLEKQLGGSGGGQRATELEARIQRLEQTLGTAKDSLAPLGLQAKNKSVLGALTVLHSKLSLLEPSHLELIETKLSAVLQKVGKIVEKKLDVQELERSLKLSSLYDLLESSSSTIEALPELSMRLEALRDLHVQASDVIRELGHVKSVQDGIAAGTTENDKLLRELKDLLTAVVGQGK